MMWEDPLQLGVAPSSRSPVKKKGWMEGELAWGGDGIGRSGVRESCNWNVLYERRINF